MISAFQEKYSFLNFYRREFLSGIFSSNVISMSRIVPSGILQYFKSISIFSGKTGVAFLFYPGHTFIYAIKAEYFKFSFLKIYRNKIEVLFLKQKINLLESIILRLSSLVSSIPACCFVLRQKLQN